MFEGLTPDRQNADIATQRVNYHPVVLTVGVPSKYPDATTQLPKGCAFEEIDGFWDWHKNDLADRNIPPQGSIIMVRLSTNPKSNPGSFYQDIQKWKYALEGEFPIASVKGGGGSSDDGWGNPAPQQTQAPSDEWQQSNEWHDTSAPSTTKAWVATEIPVNVRIAKAQAANLLSDILNSSNMVEVKIRMLELRGFKSKEEAEQVDAEAWLALRDGKTPFTSTPESPVAGIQGDMPGIDADEVIDCAHDNAMGKVPPSGGFLPGQATMHCQDCQEDFGEASDDNNMVVDDDPAISISW